MDPREEMLADTLTELSISGHPADITFFDRKPLIEVRVSSKLGAALLYGLGQHLPQLLKCIELSDGSVVCLDEIWTVNPMPAAGFSADELDAVNLAQADDRIGPNGETLREMIRDTYHCNTTSEVDYFLRRWIAS